MVEIEFSGNSTESLHRQIAAYLERIEIKEASKRGRHEKREKETVNSDQSDMG